MQHHIEFRRVPGILAGLLLAVVWCEAQTTDARTQPARTPPVSGGAQGALDPELDRILTRLEQRDVRDLRARIEWKLEYRVEDDDDNVKFGRIWYQDVDPVARFKVQFEKKRFGERLRKMNEQHFFDGLWYTEIQAAGKIVTRRQIRRPNDPHDPYRLGDGMFPLPFGQSKVDILTEFEVALVAPRDDDPAKTDHLRLTPRPGTQTEETYGQVEFWVAQDVELRGLPVQVKAAKREGTGEINSFITIKFSEIELNVGFASTVFEAKVPRGYQVEEIPLDPPAPE